MAEEKENKKGVKKLLSEQENSRRTCKCCCGSCGGLGAYPSLEAYTGLCARQSEYSCSM